MALAEFQARVRQTEDDLDVSVHVIAPDEIARLPREDAEARLSALLNQVRVRPEFVVYGFRTLASYVDPPPREAMLGHNTLVEISIPYTLHLPNDVPIDVRCPELGPASLVLRKVWTTLAAGSNDAEIYADDRLLYYGPTQPLSPFTPQAPELGPWPRYTGRNIEVGQDTYGILRYTRVRAFFDLALPDVDSADADEAVGAAKLRALDEATRIGKQIVNYLLDVYRYVTGAAHVERLHTMAVDRVYFADHNLVSEGHAVEGGVGSAIVNRSGREIQQIRAMLLTGAEPETHVLLTQSSRAALARGQLVLGVVAAFQALEILIETKLRTAYAKRGLPEADITKKLKQSYKTKDRLTVLCREVTGGQSVADDANFWDSWLTNCNRKRNGIVHRNEGVTDSEALVVVELCEQCMTRFSVLPFPV
jgi:hypothetical protein